MAVDRNSGTVAGNDVTAAGQQCDQIWRNFAIWRYFKSLGRLFEGLFSIGQKFEPAWVNILCHWASFHRCKWPNINELSSHLVTLPAGQVPLKSDSRCNPTTAAAVSLQLEWFNYRTK